MQTPIGGAVVDVLADDGRTQGDQKETRGTDARIVADLRWRQARRIADHSWRTTTVQDIPTDTKHQISFIIVILLWLLLSLFIGVDFGGSQDMCPPIIEKRLWFHLLLTISPPQYFHWSPNIFWQSLRQCHYYLFYLFCSSLSATYKLTINPLHA